MIAIPKAYQKLASDFAVLIFCQYGSVAFNIIFSVMLTRSLTPSDFGVLAALTFVFNLFNWITEWGWENGLLVSKIKTFQEAFSTTIIIRATLSLAPFLFFFLIKKMVHTSINNQNINTLILIFAGSHFCDKVGLPFKASLEKFAKIKQIAAVEFLSPFFGILSGLTAVYLGLPFFALVIQKFTEKLSLLIGYWLYSPQIKKLCFYTEHAMASLKIFGGATWLSNIFGIAIYDMLPYALSILAGAHEAGIYAKAFSLATFSLMLTTVFNKITTPIYAQNSENIEFVKNTLFKFQSLKAIILIPGQIFLTLSASCWIPRLLGSQWNQIVTTYQILSIYGLARAFYDDLGPMINLGLKKPWMMAKSQFLHSIAISCCTILLFKHANAGLASMICAISMIITTGYLWTEIAVYLKKVRKTTKN